MSLKSSETNTPKKKKKGKSHQYRQSFPKQRGKRTVNSASEDEDISIATTLQKTKRVETKTSQKEKFLKFH
jgi:hypothetical protein